MKKQPYAAVLSAVTATVFSISIEGAFSIEGALAKQQCSAEAPSDAHGYWSWRLIDGRKCWYEGKPMLSKSLLEWSAQVDPQSESNNEPARTGTDEPATAGTERPGDPMDSQARVIDDSEEARARAIDDSRTFDALWRSRITHH